MTNSSRWD